MDILTNKVESLDREKNILLEKLNMKEDNTDSVTAFMVTLNSFETSFETFDLDAKRMLIAALIQRIEVNGNHVKIHWRL